MRRKPSIPISEAIQTAADLLKLAGFEFRIASMKSESCYYGLPGRPELLRLSSHASRGDRPGFSHVVAKLTFNGNHQDEPGFMRVSPEKIETLVTGAMGRYLIACAKRARAQLTQT